MRALITGITGHIGPHLARILAEKGWQVSGLIRTTSNLKGIEGLPINLIYGDIADKESLKKALAGREACFHLAAPTTVRTNEDKKAILESVKNICELTREVPSLKRVVYVSSTVTVGVVDSPNKTLDETSFMRLSGTAYQEVKWQAEEYVRNFIKEHNADIVIVNPSTIVGPGDFRPTPPQQLIVDFLNYAGSLDWLRDRYFKGAPVWFDTGFSIIDVKDVAQGIYLAYQKGKKGERYILSGDNITLRQLHLTLAKITSLPYPFIYIPKLVMLTLAWFFTKIMKHPPMSFSLAKAMVGKYAFFSCEKAKRELGFLSRPYAESLLRAVKWFLGTQLIKESRKAKISSYLK